MERIDLHMHSTVSDGTDTPAELLRHVREAGITLFALTDHDAVRGCAMIRELRTEDDPKLVTGVEFSCRNEEGKYHILGYRFDPDSAPKQIRQILDLAEKYGLYVTAGSDYHGANKSIIRLGETNMEMIDKVPEGLTRFLEQVL